MVRYDKCVENLYDNGVKTEGRTKTLNILKVMKGAISMSKSKTGECIFRNNKTEKTNLVQTIKRHKKDNIYNVARIDTNKKLLVGRWTKILEKQSTVSAQSLFEELLDIHSPANESHTEGNKLKSYIRMRLDKMEESINGPKISFKRPPRRRASEFLLDQRPDGSTSPSNNPESFVSERKEIREKYGSDESPRAAAQSTGRQDVQMQGTVLSKSLPVKLPSIGESAGFRRLDGVGKGNKTEEEKPKIVVEERDLTDWKDWRLKDKNWILGYIHKEKTRQEDLIIRNALNKIEDEMSGANTIKRHQIKQKLQHEKEAEKRREREMQRSMASKSPVSVVSQMTSLTNQSKGDNLVRSVTFQIPPEERSVAKKKRVKMIAPDSDEEDEETFDLPVIHETVQHVPNRKPSFIGHLPVIVEHPKVKKEKSLPHDMKVN